MTPSGEREAENTVSVRCMWRDSNPGPPDVCPTRKGRNPLQVCKLLRMLACHGPVCCLQHLTVLSLTLHESLRDKHDFLISNHPCHKFRHCCVCYQVGLV